MAVCRLSISQNEASTERIGITGTNGTRNGRSRSGWLRRSTITPIATRMKANSVPMLTSSASVFSGMKKASAATTAPVIRVVRYGVPKRFETLANIGGSRPSRLIAKNTRLWPISNTRITEVMPASAP